MCRDFPLKQAYLIIAHKDDLTFYTLLRMLDAPYNDIFIHMDVKNLTYDLGKIEHYTKYSRVYHTDRTNVHWGGYSQINAELLLLKNAAFTGHYMFYHLLSGEDLPIKKQSVIYHFFLSHRGEEFISYDDFPKKELGRIKYYYFLADIFKNNKSTFAGYLRGFSLRVQKLAGISRNRDIIMKKGTNWFSISDRLARYVINHEEWIKKTFQYTFCCDEVFLQTLVYHSEFYDMVHRDKGGDVQSIGIGRMIDWVRGRPYTYRSCDISEILGSNRMFARKFQETVDRNIIEIIEQEFSEEDCGESGRLEKENL